MPLGYNNLKYFKENKKMKEKMIIIKFQNYLFHNKIWYRIINLN